MLLALLAVGCTNQSETATPPATATPATATPATASPIAVEIAFPQSAATLLGDVSGRVKDSTGTVVAEFDFESGWNVPPDWEYGDPADKSGAATTVAVDLPSSGRYTFEIDAYTLSHQPCGTCEAGYSETSIVADVDDRSIVRLPPGESEWVS